MAVFSSSSSLGVRGWPLPVGEGRKKSSARFSRARTTRLSPKRSRASSSRFWREPPDRAEGIITREWGAWAPYRSGTRRVQPRRANCSSRRAAICSRGGRQFSKSRMAPEKLLA